MSHRCRVACTLEGLFLAKAETLPFSFMARACGSEAFALVPLRGRHQRVDARRLAASPLPGPLPARKARISAEGFTASWKVSRFARRTEERANRSFLHRARRPLPDAGARLEIRLPSSSASPAAFICRLLRRLAIHPVQYALVGLALASSSAAPPTLSEHIAFAYAYAIATAACVGVITIYLVKVLHSKSWDCVRAALTALLRHALCAAAVRGLRAARRLAALFGLLAAVMIATRRVDWYRLTSSAAA